MRHRSSLMLKVKSLTSADFLAGGGEMGALTRAYGWAASPLGPPETWPQSLLGQRCRECWDEIWNILGPQIQQVVARGEGTSHENQLLPITRRGRLRQHLWTYSYSP